MECVGHGHGERSLRFSGQKCIEPTSGKREVGGAPGRAPSAEALRCVDTCVEHAPVPAPAPSTQHGKREAGDRTSGFSPRRTVAGVIPQTIRSSSARYVPYDPRPAR